MLDLGNARARRLAGGSPAPRQLAESSEQAAFDANFDPQVGDVVKYFNAYVTSATKPLGTQ